jgi:hypothetical protein
MYRYMEIDGLKWVVEGHEEGNAWWVGPEAKKVESLDEAQRFTEANTAHLYAAVLEAEAFQILE